jgi:sugar phosphate isomerase/epimerase
MIHYFGTNTNGMNRRTFTRLASVTTIGITQFHTFGLAKANNVLRIGGPVFGKYNTPEEWVGLVKAEGYTAAYCPVGTGVSDTEILAYRNAATKADITIAEVGAWSNPISPNPATAKEALEKCVASLLLAEKIGAKCCVNIAGSRNPKVWAGPHEDNFSEETFDMIVETTRKIIDAVKPTQTHYTLEAMPWIFPESPDSYLRLIKAIDRKAFGVHLDPVNMVTSPSKFFSNADLIREAFKKLGPYIKSCHAKDLILKEDTFMPQFDEVRPGLGKINYAVFLEQMKKYPSVPLMMEHLNSAEEYRLAAQYIRKEAGL